ncbi:oocyte zinc finger protein XlCOF19-like [Branchiostoma floridae]|uniref:Oocyte zinc finger protein XlCOF19-like n=1 Tax=Branchiostoma floridae TaxID=7739 RepID=A0A9J7MZH8_BRAFL|nr:oocyte zinc finger protein XlCOF19-like [Branchiostoma floridae]
MRLSTKIAVYKAVVLSALFYCCETWTTYRWLVPVQAEDGEQQPVPAVNSSTKDGQDTTPESSSSSSQSSTVEQEGADVTTQKQLLCNLCSTGKNYATFSSLAEHKRRIHGLGKAPAFHCTICDKNFVYGRDFHDHLASHNKEKKHVCTVCGNRYARRSSLLQHRRLHDPDGHKCHTCENFFPTGARLKEHQVVHTGETQHVCDVCQKKFKYKRGLITHMRHLHPQGDETPAKCTVCSKEFKCEQYLKRHMLAHSEVRPFLCDTCGKAFKSKDVLKKHTKTHTQPQPAKYVCEKCGHRFDQEDELKAHTPIHT